MSAAVWVQRISGGRLSERQEAAHRRLAGLPRHVHLQERTDRRQAAIKGAEKAAATKRAAGTMARGGEILLEGSRQRRKA